MSAENKAPQAPTISGEQIVDAARAAARFFALETTLVPGNMRQQLAVLEAVLGGVASGQLLVLDKSNLKAVESPSSDELDIS